MVVKGMVKYANLASCAFLSVICFTRKISQRATKAEPLKPHLVAQAILSLRLPKSSSTQSLVLAIGNCPSPSHTCLFTFQQRWPSFTSF